MTAEDKCQKCKTTEGVQKMELLGRLMIYCQSCFAKVASAPSTAPNLEHYFTTPTADQGGALDEAVEYAKKQPWDLISIFWTHHNDAGHNCFTINYMPRISVASTDGMD